MRLLLPALSLALFVACGGRGGSGGGGDDDGPSDCSSADQAAIQCRQDAGITLGSFPSYCDTSWDVEGTDWGCLIDLWEAFDCGLPQEDSAWDAHTTSQEACRGADDDDSMLAP